MSTIVGNNLTNHNNISNIIVFSRQQPQVLASQCDHVVVATRSNHPNHTRPRRVLLRPKQQQHTQPTSLPQNQSLLSHQST